MMTINCVSDFELTESDKIDDVNVDVGLIMKLESYFVNYFHYNGFIIFVFVNSLLHEISYLFHGVTHI